MGMNPIPKDNDMNLIPEENDMNMSYCMFENTEAALLQCRSLLIARGYDRVEAEAGEYERPHVMGLVELCRQVVQEFDEGEYGDDELIKTLAIDWSGR